MFEFFQEYKIKVLIVYELNYIKTIVHRMRINLHSALQGIQFPIWFLYEIV